MDALNGHMPTLNEYIYDMCNNKAIHRGLKKKGVWFIRGGKNFIDCHDIHALSLIYQYQSAWTLSSFFRYPDLQLKFLFP